VKRRAWARPTPVSLASREYASAPLDRGRTPWRLGHYCVVDLELSGLDPQVDEIISFAAVPVNAGRVTVGAAVSGLVRPTKPVAPASVLVHGLRTRDLSDAPVHDDALQPLLAAMTGRVLVAHEAWVEEAFLSRALARQGVRLRGPVIDTYQLARLWAGLGQRPRVPHDLSALAVHLGLPVHRPHQAMGDALTTAQLFITLATLLEVVTSETVSSLVNARRRAAFEDG